MIFEMRFYAVTHGRTADANARFTGQLPELFARHDVQCAGAWNALAGPGAPRFVYLLAYRDFAHREAAWSGFYADPQWAMVRAQTNAGHEMIESHDLFFLKPNATWELDANAHRVAAKCMSLSCSRSHLDRTPQRTSSLPTPTCRNCASLVRARSASSTWPAAAACRRS